MYNYPKSIRNLIDSLKVNINKILINKTRDYENVISSYIIKNPLLLIQNNDKKLSLLINSLNHLNPLNILNKGYSIVKSDNKVIKNVNDVKKDVIINITLSKGTINAKVMEVNK